MTRPTHSPRPIRTAPSRSHQARSVISSPSSRKLRVSPLGSCDRLLAALADLQQRAQAVRRCRSKACPCRSGRPAEGCSRCCCDARRSARRSSTSPRPPSRVTARAARSPRRASARSTSVTSSWMPRPPALAVRGDRRDRAAAAGSPAGRGGIGLRNGASACGLTIHGLTLVRKFFARNGPSG